MKTRNLFLSTIAAGGLFLISCGGVEERTIETETSSIIWTGEMLGMYKHTGTVGISSGSVIAEDGRIVGGNFTVDLSTITPTDENYDLENDKTP